MEEKYSERIQEILQSIQTNAEDFKEKEVGFLEKFKKSKNSLSLIEDFLSEVGSLTDSFIGGLEKIKDEVGKIEDEVGKLEDEIEKLGKEAGQSEREVEEIKKSMLSLRFEIVSVLDDLTYIPDVLLRENIEIILRILRDGELIKSDSIFLQFKKSV